MSHATADALYRDACGGMPMTEMAKGSRPVVDAPLMHVRRRKGHARCLVLGVQRAAILHAAVTQSKPLCNVDMLLQVARLAAGTGILSGLWDNSMPVH